MESVLPGLLAPAPMALSFAPSIEIRAFLLQRGEGNLLVSDSICSTLSTKSSIFPVSRPAATS